MEEEIAYQCDKCRANNAKIKDEYEVRLGEADINNCLQCCVAAYSTVEFLRDIGIDGPFSYPTLHKGFLQSEWDYISMYDGEEEIQVQLCGKRRSLEPEDVKICVPDFKIHPPVSSYSGSDQAVGWARDRLSECMKHEECEQARENHATEQSVAGHFPTRLLNIDALDSANANDRLVKLRRTFPPSAEYVCLSYCWGNSQHFVLNAGSYGRLIKGVPADVLPPTLRDAAIFARKLGFTWMWIDALCIRQDQPEESLEEIENMADIYAKAALTLAAMRSKDTDQGCFGTPQPEFVGLPIDRSKEGVTGFETSSSGIGFRRRIPHVMPKDLEIGLELQEDPSLHPLMLRAWAFQEFFQSVRLLLFASNELIWRCLREERCECTEGNKFREYRRDTGKEHDHVLHEFKGTDPYGDLRPAVVEGYQRHEGKPGWHKIVAEYARRQLTFPADRERAIIGLGRRFEAANSDHLTAGIWTDPEDMRVSLSWYTKSWNSLQRNAKWPTWSWLSLIPSQGAELRHPFSGPGLSKSEQQILTTTFEIAEFKNSDIPAERSSQYHLKATGKLLPVVLRKENLVMDGYYMDPIHTGLELCLPNVKSYPIHFYPDYDYFYEDIGEDFKLILLLEADNRLWFLTMAPVKKDPDMFERIGIASIPLYNLTREDEAVQKFAFLGHDALETYEKIVPGGWLPFRAQGVDDPLGKLKLVSRDLEERTIIIV